MKITFIILTSLIIVTNFSCKKYELVDAPISCDQRVHSDSSGYSSSFAWGIIPPTLDSLYIKEDCLHILVSTSGCDGNTWSMDVYDSEAIRYISPPSRNLNLRLVNNETCLTVVQKEFQFNIRHLRVEGYNTITLIFPFFGERVTYSY